MLAADAALGAAAVLVAGTSDAGGSDGSEQAARSARTERHVAAARATATR
jgi:hypothetical protein